MADKPQAQQGPQDKSAALVALLTSIVGFDPAKQPTGDKDVLAEVVAEVQKERKDKARGVIKELVVKAMEIRAKIDKSVKAFERERSKDEKDLGKIMTARPVAKKPRPRAKAMRCPPTNPTNPPTRRKRASDK